MSSPLGLDPSAVAGDLRSAGLDGWLITDFRGRNPIAKRALGMDRALLTRRWALWLPASGEPVLVVASLEHSSLPDLGVEVRPYQGHDEWRRLLEPIVGGKRVAMEWHPAGEIPHLSAVDGGLLDLVRGWGADVESSGLLAQRHLVLWDGARMASHRRAAAVLTEIAHETFERVRATPPGAVDEAGVQGWVAAAIHERGMAFDHPPIVALDAHAGDPHYSPPETGSAVLGSKFVLLLDLWAGETGPDRAFADITWMARRGPSPPGADEAFTAVLAARDAAVSALEEAWARGQTLPGAEVDDAAMEVLRGAGFAAGVRHRTGHSIGIDSAHGDGANLDGTECRDSRPVEPGLAVTVEPGLYYPAEGFGVRTEIDVAMDPGPVVTTLPQTGWVEV